MSSVSFLKADNWFLERKTQGEKETTSRPKYSKQRKKKSVIIWNSFFNFPVVLMV